MGTGERLSRVTADAVKTAPPGRRGKGRVWAGEKQGEREGILELLPWSSAVLPGRPVASKEPGSLSQESALAEREAGLLLVTCSWEGE